MCVCIAINKCYQINMAITNFEDQHFSLSISFANYFIEGPFFAGAECREMKCTKSDRFSCSTVVCLGLILQGVSTLHNMKCRTKSIGSNLFVIIELRTQKFIQHKI